MKTVLLCALALVLSTQVYAQQWEKIQYPYYDTKFNEYSVLRVPRLIAHNNILYALPWTSSYALYYSKDNGQTWRITDTNNLKSIARNVKSIGRIVFTKSSIIMTIPGGLARSFNNGQTWQKIDFFPYVQNTLDTNILGITAYNETVIIKTGTSNNVNAYISTDEGTTWKEMALPKNTFDGEHFKLFQNTLLYEGQFYDGKELVRKPGSLNTTNMRFYIISDINNPISHGTGDFPKIFPDQNKNDEFVSCGNLRVVGQSFICDAVLAYLNGVWQYTDEFLPNPIKIMNDVDYYANLPVRYTVLGHYDTPSNIFYGTIVRRKSDSALLHRYIRMPYPHNGNFEVIADDFIVSKDFDGFAALSAITDNAIFVTTNKRELYRFQKSSVSVEEEIPNANNTMTLQPHPAKDQINIRFTTPQNGLYHCELHDMMGSKIVSLGAAPLQQGQQWNLDADIHSVPNGYYRVIIKSPTQAFSVPCLIHK